MTTEPNDRRVYFVPPFELAWRIVGWRFDSEGRPAIVSRPEFLFSLDEYGAALTTVVDGALEGLAGEKSPWLALIPSERTEHVSTTHVTAPSGEIVSNPPKAAILPLTLRVVDIIEFDLAAFVQACDDVAEVVADQRIDAILDYTARVTDAFGNVAHAAGQPIGWPVLLRALETIEIDFDDNGRPKLPLMVDSLNKRQIMPYPALNTVENEAFDALMVRKRLEFNARRRTDQLSE